MAAIFLNLFFFLLLILCTFSSLRPTSEENGCSNLFKEIISVKLTPSYVLSQGFEVL